MLRLANPTQAWFGDLLNELIVLVTKEGARHMKSKTLSKLNILGSYFGLYHTYSSLGSVRLHILFPAPEAFFPASYVGLPVSADRWCDLQLCNRPTQLAVPASTRQHLAAVRFAGGHEIAVRKALQTNKSSSQASRVVSHRVREAAFCRIRCFCIHSYRQSKCAQRQRRALTCRQESSRVVTAVSALFILCWC